MHREPQGTEDWPLSPMVPLWPLQGKACSLLEEITHFLLLVCYLEDCIGPRQDLSPTFPSTLISCLSFPNPGASLPTWPIPILCSRVLLLAGILGKLQNLVPSICPTSRLPGPFQILFSASEGISEIPDSADVSIRGQYGDPSSAGDAPCLSV